MLVAGVFFRAGRHHIILCDPEWSWSSLGKAFPLTHSTEKISEDKEKSEMKKKSKVSQETGAMKNYVALASRENCLRH